MRAEIQQHHYWFYKNFCRHAVVIWHTTPSGRMHEAPMSEPFVAEIRMLSFVFPPKGWALCNGQLLPINQNQALFSLLGTRFGGNGQTTFALPNLQGRVPMHVGRGHALAEVAGEQAHTLSMGEMTQHTHVFNPSSVAATTNT